MMRFLAKSRHVRFSPFKLRPLADVVRGKGVGYALRLLAGHKVKRTVPMKKVIESAVANAKNLANVDAAQLMIKDIRVDQGPAVRYFKPGAMGRSNVYKRRFSHISVVLEQIGKKEA